jgi:hypothetical protein
MRRGARLGFTVPASQIRNSIYTPRYYDPEIDARLEELEATHELVSIQDLIDSSELQLRQGRYIDKMHYGTGPVPYIRTSDIANWELRGSPKHGIAEAVANEYRAWMDVKEMDVLLVHEGTYLIGTPCLITRFDTDILFQHHLAKMRCVGERLSGALLMACLVAPIVQRQIRARQFTADVIDSIVGRLPEVKLPLHRNSQRRRSLSGLAYRLFDGRAEARARVAALMRGLDNALATGTCGELVQRIGDEAVTGTGHVDFLGARPGSDSFTVRSAALRGDVLIPRYYDPRAGELLAGMADRCTLVSIGELADSGAIELQTGDEVGKLAYGGGDIAFVRTSDFGNWELVHDPKQRVSKEVFDEYGARQSALPGDILLVRDGTYLVGTTTIVQEDDVPMLFSGGIYRLRIKDTQRLSPSLLLALLNAQVVRRQMRNKRFTRDVIDTLGHRVREVVVPIPNQASESAALERCMSSLLARRAVLRREATALGDEVEAV